MNGTTLISPVNFTPAQVTDLNWKIVGTNDFNGDGKPDLIWQNEATGYIGVWFLNGITQTGWGYFSPPQVPDANWKIAPSVWNLLD